MATRQMHFVGYLIAGPTWHNDGAWRHPESDVEGARDVGCRAARRPRRGSDLA
jgi:hypothetical protein